jgi:hypothetical protein
MAKKSETKRSTTRPARRGGRSRSTKSQQGREKQSESQMRRSEENADMEEE